MGTSIRTILHTTAQRSNLVRFYREGATEQPASAFRARGVPEVLLVVELLAIEQARSWGARSVRISCSQSLPG